MCVCVGVICLFLFNLKLTFKEAAARYGIYIIRRRICGYIEAIVTYVYIYRYIYVLYGSYRYSERAWIFTFMYIWYRDIHVYRYIYIYPTPCEDSLAFFESCRAALLSHG